MTPFIGVALLYGIGALAKAYVHQRHGLITLSNVAYYLFGIIFIASPVVLGFADVYEDVYFAFVVIVALLSLLVASFFIPRAPGVRLRHEMRVNPSLILWAYFAYAMGEVGIRVYQVGSFGMLFTRDRGAEALDPAAYWAGGGIGAFVEMFLVPGVLVCLFVGLRRKQLVSYLVLAAMLLNALVLATNRTNITVVMTLVLFYIHFCVRKITAKEWAAIAVSLVLFMAVAAQARVGNYNYSSSFTHSFQRGLSGFGTAESFHDLTHEVREGNMPLEYGLNLVYYNPVSFVPRRLWPDKPATSANARLTQEVYNVRIGEGRQSWIRTFTVWGEGYSQFGALGVALYSVLMFGSYRLLIGYLSRFEGAEFLLFWTIGKMPIKLRGALDSAMIEMAVFALAIFLWSYIIYRRQRTVMDNSVFAAFLR